MTFEIDSPAGDELVAKIKEVDGVNHVIVINSLGGN